jgi:phosphatidylethanolamine/phosphatidyl-N-methylethanolamine N-methyltransferase
LFRTPPVEWISIQRSMCETPDVKALAGRPATSAVGQRSGTLATRKHYIAMTQLAHDWRFLRTFLAKPLRVASPVPSGRRLAEAIAAQVEPTDHPVLELGPGTGSVTQAILDRGVKPAQLVAVESDEDFAELLRERFKQSKILEGDAFALEHVLQRAGWEQAFAAIVCGVPVLTQPIHLRRSLLTTAMRWLRPGSPFIQFSYGSRAPIPPHDEVSVHHADTVWQNLVPMHIWVYRAAALAR